jgi:hypothetical protein
VPWVRGVRGSNQRTRRRGACPLRAADARRGQGLLTLAHAFTAHVEPIDAQLFFVYSYRVRVHKAHCSLRRRGACSFFY